MSFTRAIEAWQSLLGPEFVQTDPTSLQAAETATFSTQQRVPAILRPATREQVQECLRIANRFQVPIYPISSGKNWGYGSKVPAGDSSVLLDLGRMNRILDFSEEFAYVTVEPGVTQGQLFEFLAARNSGLWMDATGASPECSLIGNTMERGFGHTPYGDHFGNVCGLEVVLPSGEVVGTGFSRFPEAHTAELYRWGVGPSIDGLFSQSNLGIVTRMTIWLMPAPEYFQAFYFSSDDPGDIGPLIDALRPLRLRGILQSAAHIANDYKVLSALQQFPWDRTNGQTPLTPEQLGYFRRKLSFGSWSGSAALYGTKAQVAEARRLVKAALKGKVDKLQFLDDRKLALAGRFARPFQWVTGWDLSRTLELLRPTYGLMKGIPTAMPMESCYWRKRMAVPSDPDPDRDRCGLLWYAPIAPLDGKHAIAIDKITHEVLMKSGFEPIISLTLLTERTLACVITISYDRDIPGEDDRAMECYRLLIARLKQAGYYAYRLGIQSMETMQGDSGYDRLVRTIKHAFDPNGILAPGRYHPQPATTTTLEPEYKGESQ